MHRTILTYCFLLLAFAGVEGQVDTATVEPPTLNYVSVINEQGDVEINWSYNQPDSIDGFIVYAVNTKKKYFPGRPFDTIPDPLATKYTHLCGCANDSSIAYRVAAYKNYIDTSKTSGLTEPHFTVFLEDDWEECDNSIMLNWNKYIGWGDDSIFYNIYENNVLVERVKDTFFINTDAVNNLTYHYTIIAVNKKNGLTSKSNVVSQMASFPVPTDFINADYATVEGESIELSFTLGSYSNYFDYILMLKPPGTATFTDTLATFGYLKKIDYTFLTSDILQNYQFKLMEVDRCGRTVKESNLSTNIVLQGEKEDNVVNLNWTEYIDWDGGVESYRIYRILGNESRMRAEVSGLFYKDDISNLIEDDQTDSIRYFIEASELGTNYQSRSNTIVIYPEILLKFPTAFTPNADGTNDVFHPLNSSRVLAENYQLLIFDRWGKKVFETKNVDEGWDGKFKSGKNVTEGVYNYFVRYTDVKGNDVSQSGIITAIYP